MATNMDKDLEQLTKVSIGLPSSPEAPFERHPDKIEDGPLYVNIEEKFPELAPPEDAYEEQPAPKLAVDRRDFMRLFSASAMLGSTAACMSRPVEKVIPYVNQPVDQVPGVAVNYATTGDGALGNGIVVRTREGRPTKIEGNPEHPLSQGATDRWDQAALQALYHPERRKSPQVRIGKTWHDISWEEAFMGMADELKAANGKVGILTRGDTGSRIPFFQKFLKAIGGDANSVYTFEPDSLYAEISEAHRLAFGVEGIPRTDILRAKYLVGIGTNFLDLGVATVYESKNFARGHSFDGNGKDFFVQFESRLTTTGAAASERHVIGVDDELAIATMILEALLAQPNARGSKSDHAIATKVVSATKALRDECQSRLGLKAELFQKMATDLLARRSLVLAGTTSGTSVNGTRLQMVAILINQTIGAYGKTLHFDRGWMNPPVKAGDLQRFLKDSASLDVVFVVDCNPAFEIPAVTGINDALKKVKTVISAQVLPNETDSHAKFVLNQNHFLESWGDAQAVAGFWSTRQPVVRTQYNSKQIEDVLLWLAAHLEKPMGYPSYREYVRENWKAIHSLIQVKVDFDTFHKAVLRRGFAGRLERRQLGPLNDVSNHFANVQPPKAGLKLAVYLDNRLYAGRGAALPVLQEVGDSLTTIAWDTWVAMNPNTVKKMGLRYNEVVTVKTATGSVNIAVYPLPGLTPDAIAIPRGNGHQGVSKVTTNVGVDPLPLVDAGFDELSGYPVTVGAVATVTSTKKFYRLCAMQKHNDLANRTDIVKSVPLKAAVAGFRDPKLKRKGDRALDNVPDLYPELPKGDYSWGMAIDLDKCTGCSVCMIACSQENNVAQVGRQQILMGREMHWIRLDRYFAGPVDNPTVMTQPVMCQHCNHAPCEAVCPVFATTHDNEGMNAMTYNRCVGTRYCANACPYKVRRFNWYTYKWNTVGDEERDRNIRALNPDVTVRTKGVMEKCSLCVQRLREAKHLAKERGPKARVRDGEVKTACQQACPSDAIEFGNLQDRNSRITKSRQDFRAYLMLGADPDHKHYGIKTLPSVHYLARVDHDGSSQGAAEGAGEGHGHGHGDGQGHEQHGHDHGGHE